MKKLVLVLVSVVVVAGIVGSYVWPYLQLEFAESAHYTEKDKREYDYYTPELLRKLPRISDDYEFSYHNISGPQAFVFGVTFNGTTDTRKIRDYLSAEGYEPQAQCQTEAECWRSPRNKKDVVSLYSSTKLNLVGIEIYRSENTE